MRKTVSLPPPYMKGMWKICILLWSDPIWNTNLQAPCSLPDRLYYHIIGNESLGFVPNVTDNRLKCKHRQPHSKQNYMGSFTQKHCSSPTQQACIVTLLDRIIGTGPINTWPILFFWHGYVPIFSWVNVSPSNSTIRKMAQSVTLFYESAHATCIFSVNSKQIP